MPCAGSQLTVMAPFAGWGKLKIYGPAPEPKITVEAVPLIRRSPASTPVTLSENMIDTLVSEVTPELAVGVVVVTVGAARRGNMPVHNRTSINLRVDFMRGGRKFGEMEAVGILSKFCFEHQIKIS